MSFRDQLERLMGETPEACRSRESTAFDNLVHGSSGIVLFGAGGLGKKVLSALRADGREPLAFVDNKLAGKSIEGLDVLTPAEAAAKWGQTAVFVVTIWAAWADAMLDQIRSLKQLGCRNVISFLPVLWKYSHLLPHVQIDLPSRVLEQKEQVLEAFDLWADEDSREEFIAELRWRLFGEFDGLIKPKPDAYWQSDIVHLTQDSVFADCGAFDGDTFAQFVNFTRGKFKSAYLFEPDQRNLRALETRLEAMPQEIRERVHIIASAVAEGDYDVSFQGGSGQSSATGEGSETVHCVSLDNSLPLAPDMIKFDIEGFELLALRGAQKIIENDKPALAVCAYHLQDHIWKIPLLVNSIRQDYKFYLRPHGQIWETVCYAIP